MTYVYTMRAPHRYVKLQTIDKAHGESVQNRAFNRDNSREKNTTRARGNANNPL